MNLGQSVAVSLYELARVSQFPPQATPVKQATAGHLDRVTALLLEALRSSGYVKAGGAATEAKIRRFVRRLQLNQEDGELLLGMLRKIVGKLDRAKM